MDSCISPTKSNLCHDPSAQLHDNICNDNYCPHFCLLLNFLPSRSSCILPGKGSSLALPPVRPFFCLSSHYQLPSFVAEILLTVAALLVYHHREIEWSVSSGCWQPCPCPCPCHCPCLSQKHHWKGRH